MTTWDEKLAEWRKQERERAGAVTVLLSRSPAPLQVLIAAWPNIARGWRSPTDAVPEEDRDAWWKMWGQIPDQMVPEVARATGLTSQDARSALLAAVTNRLIYPDGSLTEAANAWLASDAAATLTRRAARGGK